MTNTPILTSGDWITNQSSKRLTNFLTAIQGSAWAGTLRFDPFDMAILGDGALRHIPGPEDMYH
jgi:hypothetical protein